MSTSSAARSTRASGEETRRRIEGAALELLVEQGMDRLGLPALAKAAGMSTGPIYSRYDSGEDVVIDLWEEHLRSRFEQLLETVAAWGSADGKALDRIGRLISEPDQEAKALVEVLAVARRYPHLLQQVQVDVDRLLVEILISPSDMAASIATARAYFALGGIFGQPIFEADAELVARSVAELETTFRSDATAPLPPVPALPVLMPLPRYEKDDVGLSELVEATMATMATYGFEHATANRIARRAGRSFSSVYSRFSGKEALMEAAIEALSENILALQFRPFIGLSEEDYIAAFCELFVSRYHPMNRNLRALQIEVALAARHHEALRLSLKAATDATRSVMLEATATTDAGVLADVRSAFYLSRIHELGLNLIGQISDLPASQVPTAHAVATQQLMTRLVFDHLPAATSI